MPLIVAGVLTLLYPSEWNLSILEGINACMMLENKGYFSLLLLTVLGMGIGLLCGASRVEAAELVSGAAWQSLPSSVSVQIAASDQPRAGRAQGRIGFSYFTDPTARCQPNEASFTAASVVVEIDGQSAGVPLYTTAWTTNNSTSEVAVDLSVSIPGYELQPQTEYQVKFLKNGVEAAHLICQDSSKIYMADLLASPLVFTTGKDTFAPSVYGVKTAISMNSARVSWSTGESTTGWVEYGTSKSYGQSASSDGSLDHLAILTKLKPGAKYYYRIASQDRHGNKTKAVTGSLTTWSMGKITLKDITAHEATVIWTTSQPTDSMIEYGPTSKLGLKSGSHQLSKKHSVRLVHLNNKTNYYFKIVATTEDMVATTSLLRFATLDGSAPELSSTIEFDSDSFDQFEEWNSFNLKDYPPDAAVLADKDEGSSEESVLAATDNPWSGTIASQAVTAAKEKVGGWIVWLWWPVLLLLILIGGFYMYSRHDVKMNNWRLEMKKLRK